jgi:cation diffusion facilitator family transporter
MHDHSLEPWKHRHVFLGARHARNERRTWMVVALTAVMMVVEIVAGIVFGSLALLADGWHMATHAGALGIAAYAYRFARQHAHDPRFSFGTAKAGELAAFSSAIVLALIALAIAYEALIRLVTPVAIRYDEAIAVAVIGLVVNLACAWLLFDRHEYAGHSHSPAHDHPHGHLHKQARDHNLRAAFAHVATDALTSVLAIAGLSAGRLFGWTFMDPVVGLVGAGVIVLWAWKLARDSGAILLDVVPDPALALAIRARLEADGDHVSDLHLWRLGPGHMGVIAALVTQRPQPPAVYKERLHGIEGLSHITVEVHDCSPHHRASAA